MSKYLYSIIRCLPDPRTGEFVNVGVIAGDPATGDWAIRRLSNIERIRRFASDMAIEVADRFMTKVAGEINDSLEALEDDAGEPLSAEWLDMLHRDHRNIVQLSTPAPILADRSESALDLIFTSMISDPAIQRRQITHGRNRVIQDLRDAYARAAIPPALIHAKANVFIGDRLHSPIDFAIANGSVLQLTQAWSFQVTTIDNVSMRVKAWGYALERLRRGEDARVVDAQNRVSAIDRGVDLQIVVIPPATPRQEVAYEEAEQVFTSLSATVHDIDSVDVVGTRAARLLEALH